MIFRKRGGIRYEDNWNYNGINLEVVTDFDYLGAVFNYTGDFALNQEYLAGKGTTTLNVLSKAELYIFRVNTSRHTISL